MSTEFIRGTNVLWTSGSGCRRARSGRLLDTHLVLIVVDCDGIGRGVQIARHVHQIGFGVVGAGVKESAVDYELQLYIGEAWVGSLRGDQTRPWP